MEGSSTPILQMKQLRSMVVKGLSKGHKASKQQGRIYSRVFLTSKSMTLFAFRMTSGCGLEPTSGPLAGGAKGLSSVALPWAKKDLPRSVWEQVGQE